MTTDRIVIHPLDVADASMMNAMRAMVAPFKGKARGIEGRGQFDALMEGVEPRTDVTFEDGTVGGISGIWVRPATFRAEEAILHLHAGWFTMGTAKAFRHLAGQVTARAGAQTFIPDYRLAPEHPFPAAAVDVLACYRGLASLGIQRVALTGDSAGGNLAFGLASRVVADTVAAGMKLVAVVASSPVTDLTLSAETYSTRADADPYFTRPQVIDLVAGYLKGADPKQPLASPLHAQLAGLPPIRVHVGDAEVLLDDSRRYVERAIVAGIDARLDVWMGMPHGFNAGVGRFKAAALALDAIGAFLTEKLRG